MEGGFAVACQPDFSCAVRQSPPLAPFGVSNPRKANRCFVNAAVQCLLRLDALPLDRLAKLEARPEAIVWRALLRLRSDVAALGEKERVATVGRELVELVGKVGEQQDAHELLMVLMSRLDAEALMHSAGKKKKKKPKKKKDDGFTEVSKGGKAVVVNQLGTHESVTGPLTELVGVILAAGKKATKKTLTKTLEPSFGVSVPLSDDWASYASKQVVYHELPRGGVLIVHLVRESDDYGTLLKSHVSARTVLQTQELTLQEAKTGQQKSYELVSVLLHAGDSLFRGHYTARLRIEGVNRWSMRDDAHVATYDSIDDMLGPFMPYLLFFVEKK